MGMSSTIQSFFEKQTALDKLALALIWASFPVIDLWGGMQFVGMLALTGWIILNQRRARKEQSSFD